jgi:predicted outer membrane protein
VRLRELINLLDTHEPSTLANVFAPEAGLALDWSDKTNALPIGNRDNDELSRALQTRIVAAADNLPEHSQLFIAKDPTDLSQMEHFLLQRLRKNHSFEKVYSGDTVDIYQLAPRSARNDLGVPLITHGATPELEAALDFNPVTWYTSPTGANSFEQSLGFTFEHPEVVQAIQLFGRPNFPEFTPDIAKITVITAANDRVDLDPSAYTMQEATNAELNTLVKNFRFDYPDPVKEVILTMRAPKITATQYVFFIGEIEFY